MTLENNNQSKQAVPEMRESFSARLMTNRQYDEAVAITHIVEREIKRSGAFKEKLGDYAYAFSRNERFDPVQAETMLRDLFRQRTGQSMNDLRKELVANFEKVTEDDRNTAYRYAAGIGSIMENGNKLTFNRSVAHQAQELAGELRITDAAARSIMAEEFEAVENQKLWDWGKELDEQFYRPQIEAEKTEREAQQSKTRTKGNSRAKSRGPSRGGPQ